MQRLQFIESLELASSELKLVNQVLRKVSAKLREVSHFDYSLNKHQVVGMILDGGSCKTLLKCNYKSCWVPFDIYMEHAMDSRQIFIKSAIDVLTGKSLMGFIRFVSSCCNHLSVTQGLFSESYIRIQVFPNSYHLFAEGIKTFQIFNQTSWHETFLALWLSALRLVQRVETDTYSLFFVFMKVLTK